MSLFFLVVAFLSFMCVVAVIYVYWYVKVSMRTLFLLNVGIGWLVDKKVDFICEKAVIIAEEQFRTSDDPASVREQKVIERAVTIIADVLLQHGINPRDYHLPGLVFYARYKLGLDTIQKEVKKNG